MAYITYLTDPDYHTNSAPTHPGMGDTKEESRANATYYNNQWPWVRTVAASKAPRWAQRTARDSRWLELQSRDMLGRDHPKGPLNKEEIQEWESYEFSAMYG